MVNFIMHILQPYKYQMLVVMNRSSNKIFAVRQYIAVQSGDLLYSGYQLLV